MGLSPWSVIVSSNLTFSHLILYSLFMKKILLLLTLPLSLSGCTIGALISGNTGYLEENYPDIRTVPEKAEASASRGCHGGEEIVSRAAEFKQLEQDREKIMARDQALREKAFPSSK
jgi:hypothetical protein